MSSALLALLTLVSSLLLFVPGPTPSSLVQSGKTVVRSEHFSTANKVTFEASAVSGSPPYSPHANIIIESDSGFTAANGVRSGNGTSTSPYVISGWSITTDGPPGEVSISNTRAFFTISNVTGAQQVSVNFSNVTSGRLENSNVMGLCGPAILISFSNKVMITHDVAFSGIHRCGGDAIDIASSTNAIISDNSLGSTEGSDLNIAQSHNITVTGNNIAPSDFYGMHVIGSSNISISLNNFTNSGLVIENKAIGPNTYSITSDNMINGRPLLYYYGCDGLTLDGVQVGQLIIVNCSNVRLSNLNITRTDAGIMMQGVRQAIVENVNASANNWQNIYLTYSSGVSIEDSTLSFIPDNFARYGTQTGLFVVNSTNILANRNSICCEYAAIRLSGSNNVVITGNSISAEFVLLGLPGPQQYFFGFPLLPSTDIHVFHNNFLQICGTSFCNFLTDTNPRDSWDNGYPSGGNYYSNYPPFATDTDQDGIGDTPYRIEGGIYFDRYPLMKPFGQPVTGILAFSPRTVSSHGGTPFLIVRVTLANGFSASNLILSSIRLNDTLPLVGRHQVSRTANGLAMVLVTFDMAQVRSLLPTPGDYTLTITANILTQTSFRPFSASSNISARSGTIDSQ